MRAPTSTRSAPSPSTCCPGKSSSRPRDDLELTSKILNEEPPRVSQVAAQPIPVELDLLVQSCLEKRREDRPQRAADLLEALDAIAAEARR